MADFDGDGRLDLAGHYYNTDDVYFAYIVVVALGTGGFSFGAPMEYGAAFYWVAVEAGDLDEDGRPDLVTAANDRVSVHVNRGPRELSFARDGVTLGWPLDEEAASFEVYRGAVSELVDADRDGLPDAGYGVCLGETGPAHNEWIEPDVPAIDEGYFYLVSTVDPLGVRDLGTTSAGYPRLPAEICP